MVTELLAEKRTKTVVCEIRVGCSQPNTFAVITTNWSVPEHVPSVPFHRPEVRHRKCEFPVSTYPKLHVSTTRESTVILLLDFVPFPGIGVLGQMISVDVKFNRLKLNNQVGMCAT